MNKQQFTVLVKTDATDDNPAGGAEHTVTIRHADMLRAELEMPKNRLPDMKTAPMHHTTCWVWAALTREGHYAKPFAVFLRTDCLDLDAVKDETPDDGGDEVGPTEQAAPTALPSS